MTSDHKLRAEVADLRLQLEQRTRSEEKALEERTRLERMLQDSQRFLVEDEVKLEQCKQQVEKREAELSDARQTLVAREATVQQLAQEVLQLRRELAEEREQKRKLQFKEASLRRAALAKPLGAATELLLQEPVCVELAGVLAGNAVVDINQTNFAWFENGATHGLVPPETWQELRRSCDFSQDLGQTSARPQPDLSQTSA